jgi:PAS domain S-box-containing protein
VIFGTKWGGGLPGHKPFVGVGADPSVASLALAALDVLPGGSVMVFDTEMRYVLVRGRALFDRGFTSSFLEGRLVADALSSERWAFYEPLYRSALLGETYTVEIASPDGEGWYAVEVCPLRAPDGEIVGGVSFAIDVSERKRAGRQLLTLVDVAPNTCVLADPEGRIAFGPAGWPEGGVGELASDHPLSDSSSASPLTPRELQVLALASDGASVPAIARELVVSPTTVQTHLKNIYGKLYVHNRAAAVAKAIRLGIIR